MEKTKLKYNTPIEVSKDNYIKLNNEWSGVCAFREEDGRYFVMVWIMRYRNEISKIINS